MAWEAHTNFRQIGAGTTLHLIESPTVPGYPPGPIQVGSDMAVEFAAGTRGKVKVISASQDEMVIQEPSGRTWKLTPWLASDFPVSIDSPGLNSQDWVVRSETQS
jgi:hypothetical protein